MAPTAAKRRSWTVCCRSAEYFKPDLEFKRMQARYGMQVEAEMLRPILEVHADYLQAAFDAIDTEFGSVEDYLGGSLGMDSDKCELLRRRYLV